jgi:hypothetical protein
MTPCESDTCPTYPAAGPFMYAVETEVGRIDPPAPVDLDVASIDN